MPHVLTWRRRRGGIKTKGLILLVSRFYDRFGYQKKPIVGCRGAELLFYDIANAILDYQYPGDRTQQQAELDTTDMVLWGITAGCILRI